MKTEITYAEKDNIRVAYRIRRMPGAPAIMFVHGLGADSRFFQKQLNYFAPPMTAIALDLPWHGKSSAAGEVSLDNLVEALRIVMEKEGLEKVNLAGHSLGGCVALEFYFNYPAMVESLVLISTGARLSVAPFLKQHLADSPLALYRILVGAIFSKKRDLMVAMAEKNVHLFNREFFEKSLDICSSVDFTGRLKDIDLPLLAIANRDDRLVSAELTGELADHVPGAEFVLIEAGGHVPFFEYPELFDHEVEGFLRKYRGVSGFSV